jgi:hypothetical protein
MVYYQEVNNDCEHKTDGDKKVYGIINDTYGVSTEGRHGA